MKRTIALAGFVVGLAALVLQFAITITASIEAALARSGTLTFSELPKTLVYPVAYLLHVLLRAVVGEYPYPVLEADRLGYGQVAINVAGPLLILLVLAAAAIAVDRIGGGNRQSPSYARPSRS